MDRPFAGLLLSAVLTLGSGCAEDRPPPAPAPEPFAGVPSLILKTLDDTRAASLAVAVAKDGEMGFADGLYRGLFLGRIDTPDAARAPHVVLVELRRRGERLVGTASAVARNESYCLPYFMELSSTQ